MDPPGVEPPGSTLALDASSTRVSVPLENLPQAVPEGTAAAAAAALPEQPAAPKRDPAAPSSNVRSRWLCFGTATMLAIAACAIAIAVVVVVTSKNNDTTKSDSSAVAVTEAQTPPAEDLPSQLPSALPAMGSSAPAVVAVDIIAGPMVAVDSDTSSPTKTLEVDEASVAPTGAPSESPIVAPSIRPHSEAPSESPSVAPSTTPIGIPVATIITNEPTTKEPSKAPTDNPTTFPTKSPTKAPTIVPPLVFVANNIDFQTNPLLQCQGDCDTDSDCQGPLICYQRTKGQPVPGCYGNDYDSETDYCTFIGATMAPVQPTTPRPTVQPQQAPRPRPRPEPDPDDNSNWNPECQGGGYGPNCNTEDDQGNVDNNPPPPKDPPPQKDKDPPPQKDRPPPAMKRRDLLEPRRVYNVRGRRRRDRS